MNSQFDWQFYTEYYEDLQDLSSSIQAYDHWINFGKQEGRVASEEEFYQKYDFQKSDLPTDFNWQEYLEVNPDLKGRLHSKWPALRHFIVSGIKEGRKYSFQSSKFDWQFYTEYHEDLKDLSSYELAHNHWIKFGQQEGRITSEEEFYQKYLNNNIDLLSNFNWQEYLEINSDLSDRIHSKWQAIRHFIVSGLKEGRRYSFNIQDEIDSYSRAIKKEPEQPFSIYATLIKRLEYQGRLERAIDVYQQGIKFYPQQQFFEESLYYKMLELKPDDDRLYVALANELARQERKEGAIACYQMALLIKPDAPDIAAKLQALAS